MEAFKKGCAVYGAAFFGGKQKRYYEEEWNFMHSSDCQAI